MRVSLADGMDGALQRMRVLAVFRAHWRLYPKFREHSYKNEERRSGQAYGLANYVICVKRCRVEEIRGDSGRRG